MDPGMAAAGGMGAAAVRCSDCIGWAGLRWRGGRVSCGCAGVASCTAGAGTGAAPTPLLPVPEAAAAAGRSAAAGTAPADAERVSGCGTVAEAAPDDDAGVCPLLEGRWALTVVGWGAFLPSAGRPALPACFGCCCSCRLLLPLPWALTVPALLPAAVSSCCAGTPCDCCGCCAGPALVRRRRNAAARRRCDSRPANQQRPAHQGQGGCGAETSKQRLIGCVHTQQHISAPHLAQHAWRQRVTEPRLPTPSSVLRASQTAQQMLQGCFHHPTPRLRTAAHIQSHPHWLHS